MFRLNQNCTGKLYMLHSW